MNKQPVIGVLALQGAVELHKPHIEGAGAIFKAVKTLADFDSVDAFILPGGESTTMLKLIQNFDLEEPLKRAFKSKPVWGICAGTILMAKTVTDPAQKSFGLLDINVQRNGYGRQLDSEIMPIDGFDVSFIRAPIITGVNDNEIEVLAIRNDQPVWIQKGRYMATTFHPELTLAFPSPMHQRFIDLAR